MSRRLKPKKLKSRLRTLSTLTRLRSESLKFALSRRRLPPGSWTHLYGKERSQRDLILQLAAEHGPIFKGRMREKMMVCVVGMPLCRQFITECKQRTRVATVDLTALFPRGFLRGMEGEDHKKYRAALVRGLSTDVMERNAVVHQGIVERALKDYSLSFVDGPGPADAFKRTLNAISSASLIQTFFGFAPNSSDHDRLSEKYGRLGDGGFSWSIGARQTEVYREIRNFLLGRLERGVPVAGSSVLGNMQASGLVDETSLGNLIYMVEMGRHDVSGLFRWLSKYAAEYPACLKSIQEEASSSGGDGGYCFAFIQEALRLNQVERLTRNVERDIEFGGYLIPKGALVRLCLWESHKDPDNFPDPFAFKPERFLDADFSLDEYAPFGLDHHRCPVGEMSMKMGAMLLNQLATDYVVEAFGDGPPHRARSHWEPAREFTLRLSVA